MTTLPVAFDIPQPGEITAAQNRAGSAGSSPKGFEAPLPASLKTWRTMRCDPTIGMARIAGNVLIKTSHWRFEADDGVPDDVLEFAKKQMNRLRAKYVKNALFALDYGFQTWEKCFTPVQFKGRTFIGYDKLKPLTPDDVEIQQLKTTGAFDGIKQGDVQLGPNKCLLFTYDEEAGNPYGRPRHENCRTEWSAKRQTLDRLGLLVTKVTGVVPIMQYPPGESLDVNNARVSNFDIARAMLRDLSKGIGIALPNTLAKHLEQAINRGLKPEDLKAWALSFLETQPGHGEEIVQVLEYFDKLCVRGWLVPERAVTEATMAGSRADSNTAIDLALLVAQDTLGEIITCANEYVINPLLTLNGGSQYADMVRAVPEPLDDEEWAMAKDIVKTVLTNPSNVDLALKLLDFDNMLDQLGLPQAMKTADALEEDQQTQDLQDQLKAAMLQQKPAPGDPPKPEDDSIAGGE